MDLHQLTQEMGKIHSCPSVGQLYYSLAGQRFKRDEQVYHTAAAVFIILSPWTSRFRRNPISCRFVSSRQTTGRRGS